MISSLRLATWLTIFLGGIFRLDLRTAEPPPLPSKPFLWKIEGRKPSYLFGTLHIPDKRVTTLPARVTQCLESSDAVYIEVDPSDPQSSAAMQTMMLPPDQSLSSILPADLQKRLQAYLRSRNVFALAFDGMKVWAAAINVRHLDHEALPEAGEPMDRVILQYARLKRKETGGLETALEQCAAFDSLSTEEQVQYLRLTIEALETQPEHPDEKAINLYLAGDSAALAAQLHADLHSESPVTRKLTQRLVVERDSRIADRIEAKLKAHPQKSHFFAIGAAHLGEKDGVVGLLVRKGFTITRLSEP